MSKDRHSRHRTRQRLIAPLIGLITYAWAAYAVSSEWGQARLRLGASALLKYRLAAVFEQPADGSALRWILEPHLDSAYVDGGFVPLNAGLELGVFPPGFDRFSVGLNWERPFYTQNTLAGLSVTARTGPADSRFNFYFSAQWLHYLDPVDGIGDPKDTDLYNLLAGFSLLLGNKP